MSALAAINKNTDIREYFQRKAAEGKKQNARG